MHNLFLKIFWYMQRKFDLIHDILNVSTYLDV